MAYTRFPKLFILPPWLLLVGIVIFPLFYSLYLSVTDFGLLRFSFNFVGATNYAQVFQDPVFLSSIIRTFVFTAITLVAQIILGFGIALLFNRKVFGLGVLRTILVSPMLLAPVVVGLTWRFMYDPSIGVLNYTLSLLHLPAIEWISTPSNALYSVAIAEIWQWTPFAFLVFLAALQGIPTDVEEAAKIDGVEWWRRIWEIQIPMIKPVIYIVVLIRLIDALKSFDLVYIITRGGPGDATYLLSFFTYVMAFGRGLFGTSTAASYLILIMIMVIVTVLMRVLYGKEGM